MVVRDFDFFGMGTLPSETNAKLIVNADAVLSQAVSAKLFEAIARRGRELGQFANTVDLSQLASRDPPEVLRTSPSSFSAVYAVEEVLRCLVCEGSNHGLYYNGYRDNTPATGVSALTTCVSAARA